MRRLIALLFVAAPAFAAAPPSPLAQLADDLWDYTLASAPEEATLDGDHRFDGQLTDYSEAAHTRRETALAGFVKRLDGIAEAGLSADDRVTRDFIAYEVGWRIHEEEARADRHFVDAQRGPQTLFAETARRYHPKRDLRDAETLLARYRALPRQLADYQARLREGADAGLAEPKVSVEKVVNIIDTLLAGKPADSPFAHVWDDAPKSIAKADLDRVRAELAAAVARDVFPAFASLRTFLHDDYLPRARADVGLWAARGGDAIYAADVRRYTSTERTPAEIHQLGLDELARIEKEETAIAVRVGKTDKLLAFRKQLHDEHDVFADRAAMITHARAVVDRFRAKMSSAFGRLPRAPLTVEAIPAYLEEHSAAHYDPPADDGSRQATYWINAATFASTPTYDIEALTAHEAIPGHHFQVALAQEMTGQPRLRRMGWINAFGEGWALYAERLVDELGLYSGDRARFQMLDGQAFRACRLVVDTGMHAMKWTRQQAIDFMKAHVNQPDAEIVREIDRYIAWPGQALGYMVGRMAIDAERRRAEAALGKKFQLSKFHDEVLGAGVVPLTTLHRRIDEWIARGG